MNVGYVGLGAMGGALARRLLLARKVHVFDIRRETAEAMMAEVPGISPAIISG